MKDQIAAITARVEAAGFTASGIHDVKHWIASRLEDLQIHQLLDGEGRWLATFITRLPAGKSARKLRTVCLTEPQHNVLTLASAAYSLGRRVLTGGEKTKPGQLSKAMEAEHGVQYAEWYDSLFETGVDEQSYFVIAGKLLTSPDHLLQKVGGQYQKHPDVYETCELMGWTLKQIW